MKNIYLFIIFLFLTGCGYNLTSNTKISDVSCPSILFGSDHKVYIDSSNKGLNSEEYFLWVIAYNLDY